MLEKDRWFLNLIYKLSNTWVGRVRVKPNIPYLTTFSSAQFVLCFFFFVFFFFDNVSQKFGVQTSFHLQSSFWNYISGLFVPVSEILITLHKSCFSTADWTNTRRHMRRSRLEIITFFNSGAAGTFAATTTLFIRVYCCYLWWIKTAAYYCESIKSGGGESPTRVHFSSFGGRGSP